ncbi:VWA domain-containing protein [Yoonia sediminilitoris]|nr:VWA domain-containing protein [Yoonia sediminilitoris]
MLEFADPRAFFLLPLPVLSYFLLPRQMSAGTALVVPEGVGRHIMAGAATGARGLAGVRLLAPFAVWVLLVTALAGPRALAPQQALPMSGRDLMIALDLSGSMVRDDFTLDGAKATRLDAVKHVGAAFARARAGDRVGLVVFGSEAYVAAAPTFDTDAIARTITELVIGISGRATNISDGLGLSLKRLESSDADTKVVILLSDGANNAGAATPRDVAALAGKMGVRVHTIALGPIALAEAPDQRGVVDVDTLRAMSDLSGGQMFRVRTTDDLRGVAQALDALEPTARAGLSAQTYREYWIWPALLAGALSLWFGLWIRR